MHMSSVLSVFFMAQDLQAQVQHVKGVNHTMLIQTSKSVDPLTPFTLIYDSFTLPIMCKCMYRKSSRKNARVNTALNDLQINLTCSNCQNGKKISCCNLLFKAC